MILDPEVDMPDSEISIGAENPAQDLRSPQ